MAHDRNLRSPSNPAVFRNQVKLSSAQVQAARIVIGKVVPGLKSVEMVDMTGDPEKPIEGTTIEQHRTSRPILPIAPTLALFDQFLIVVRSIGQDHNSR